MHGMNFLARKKRERLRQVARQEYSVACRKHADFLSEKVAISEMAIFNARKRLSQSSEYGGILNALLLAVATKLIVALITKWVEENIQAKDLPDSFQPGEPGNE